MDPPRGQLHGDGVDGVRGHRHAQMGRIAVLLSEQRFAHGPTPNRLIAGAGVAASATGFAAAAAPALVAVSTGFDTRIDLAG